MLKAVAEDGNIKKVVLTSSCTAVNGKLSDFWNNKSSGYPQKFLEGQPQDKVFDETSWTNIESRDVNNYVKSKTLAEREAWSFLESLPKEKR